MIWCVQFLAISAIVVVQGEPTIRRTQSWDASKDAQALRAAMKGWGTDEKVIWKILTSRTNDQRLEIERKYTEKLDRNLISDLKSELDGKFEDLVIALMKSPVDFLCSELHDAITGFRDSTTLIEILVTRNSSAEIKEIAQNYETLYNRPMVEHVLMSALGRGDDYRRLLSVILTETRDATGKVDLKKAKEQATALVKAGVERWGTDETEFINIFGRESYAQLALVFDEYYKQEKGQSIEQALKAEFSGNMQELSLAIVECSTHSRAAYYAKRLRSCLNGIGTDDRNLIRIIVSRSEIDLLDIKKEYEHIYGHTLESRVKSDTSGDYEDALVSIIRGN